MPESGNVQAAAAVSIGQVVTVYSIMLPPLTQVRRATADDPAMRGDVRMGQVGAAAVVIGIGFVLSNLTGSMVPTGIAIFMSAVISAVYESAMRQNGENHA